MTSTFLIRLMQIKSDIYNVFLLIVIAILGYLSLYLFNVILAHYLPPYRVGEFNIAIRVLNILSCAALLGTNVSSKRFLTRFIKHKKDGQLREFIAWNLQLIRPAFLLCVLVALGSYVCMHALHMWGLKDIRTYHLSIYMLWIAPLAALFLLLNSYLLCINSIAVANILANIKSIFFTLCFLALVFLYPAKLNSLVMTNIFFFSFALLTFLELYLIAIYSPKLRQYLRQALQLQTDSHQDWLASSLKMSLNTLVYLVLTTTDLLLVQFICVDKKAVGLYAVALTVVSVILLIPQSIQSLLKPRVSPLIEDKEGKKQLQTQIKTINRIMLVYVLVAGAGISFFSKAILLHFGAVYLEAQSVLYILILAYTLTGFSQSATTVITYAGYESLLLKISSIELIVLVLLGIPLTFYLGIVGAGVALLCSMCIKAFGFHFEAYRQTGLKTFLV